MIKIRYSELQAGLHASAAKEGRHTVIDLLPGLSPAERGSAIDRLRASAKVGHGPKLPTIPLTVALIADRIKQNTRNAAAAARLHPTGLAIPAVVLTSGAILYALLVTVSVNLGLPATSDLAIGALPVAEAPASSGHMPPRARAGAPVAGNPADPVHGSRLTGDQGAGGKSRSKSHGKPGPAPSGGSPSSQPSTGPSPTSSPTPSPSRSASPTPSPSPTKHHGGPPGSCLNLGLIRLCV